MLNINLLIDRDIFCCPICCNEFDLFQYNPICITCGHTICKICLDKIKQVNTLVCPIDKKKINLPAKENKMIKNQYENNIIIKLLRVIDCSYIDLKPLTALQFYFCQYCDKYISKYLKNVHSQAGHQVLGFREKLSFTISEDMMCFSPRKLISNKCTSFDTLTVLLMYFYNSDIFKTYSLYSKEVFHTEHHYDEKFSFIGHRISFLEERNNIFECLKITLTEEIEQKDKACLIYKAGFLITKQKEIIYGMFIFDKYNKIYKGFGIFKDENTLYFGFMNFSNNMEITFKAGILLNGNNFYFGFFSDTDAYPLFKLVDGEKTQLKGNYSEIYNRNLKSPVVETFKNNTFFKITNKKIGKKQKVLDNSLNTLIQYRIDIIRNENCISIKYDDGKGGKMKEEYQIHGINQNINSPGLLLRDCYITFKKPFANYITFRFLEKRKLVFYRKKISQNYFGFLYIVNDSFSEYTTEDLNNKEFINFLKLQDLSVRDLLHDLSSFINSMVGFLLGKADNFEIFYQEYTQNSDIKVQNTQYVKIIPSENCMILYNPSSQSTQKFQNSKLSQMQNYEYLSSIYKDDMNQFLEELHVNTPRFEKTPSESRTQTVDKNQKCTIKSQNKDKVHCRCQIF
jgi:hypothetical protein